MAAAARLAMLLLAAWCLGGCTSFTRLLVDGSETDFHRHWDRHAPGEVDLASLEAQGVEYHILADDSGVLIDRLHPRARRGQLWKLPVLPLALAADALQVAAVIGTAGLAAVPYGLVHALDARYGNGGACR